MKHLKTYESYNDQEMINEGVISTILKYVIGIPLGIFMLGVLNFFDPRKLEILWKPLLNVYENADILIDTLENIHFNKPDITDTERSKILDKINELKKMKKKQPTLDLYKKELLKTVKWANIRNRDYLKEQVTKYQPLKMKSGEVIEEIKKIYKLVNENDIIGDVRQPNSRWSEIYQHDRGFQQEIDEFDDDQL